jgi:hypothetical protein
MGWGGQVWGNSPWGLELNLPPPQPSSSSQVANSTTYIDLLGLQLGLIRIPGESAINYLKRLEAASVLRRDHPYEGALNEINLQLGLAPSKYINIQLPVDTVVKASIAGVIIGTHPIIPLVQFDTDSMWNFRMLSDVVVDINKLVPATLLVADGPAFQIARQTNSIWSFSESISSNPTRLLQTGIQVGSEVFNQSVPPYTLTSDGLIKFTTDPDGGTEITYNYVVTPYNLVGAPVSMIGFTDPEFASVATTTGNVLSYQVSEFLQAIMTADRSYWTE